MTEAGGSGQAVDVQRLIEYVAKSLVDDPEKVSVTVVEEPGETVIELEVGPRDVGKVIGKQGRTVRAMRSLLSAAGVRSRKRFELDIIEPETAEEENRQSSQ
jgi:uncharacterized protein